MTRWPALLLLCSGCGGGGFYAGGFPDAAEETVAAGDDAQPDAHSEAGPDGSPTDAGAAATDADPLAHCRVLGESCEASDDCACADDAGCAVDNVICDNQLGVCVIYQHAVFDPDAASCCLLCENGYQNCGGSSRDPCFDTWEHCNAYCGGCSVGCRTPN